MGSFCPTPEQKAAIENEGGALLVSAAAGSGKTRVLVERVMRRLTDPNDPRDIHSFLIITYTKAAAAELRGKLANAIGEALAQDPGSRQLQKQLSLLYLAQISTVHSFCANILRDHAHELGLTPDFHVAEEADAVLWKKAAMEDTLDHAYPAKTPNQAAFLDRLGAGRDDRRAAQILLQAYTSVQCHPEPDRWIAQCLDRLQTDEPMEATPWGQLFIEEFHQTLQGHIAAMQLCLSCMDDPVRAAYGKIYDKNLADMEALLHEKSWEALWSRRITDFGRLPPVRGYGDKDYLNACKKPRADAIAWLREAQLWFSMSTEEAMAELRDSLPTITGMFELLEDFTRRYRAIKERHRALDFGDLEQYALKLLRTPKTGAPTPAARELSRRFTEIMVDEYQDSNRVQECIFQAVSRNGENLFLVGDVKQSIYRFRLADPSIFLEKYDAYPMADQAAPGQGRKLILSNNFRSQSQLLAGINEIFRLCMSKQVGDLDYGEKEALYPPEGTAPSSQPCMELHCLDTAQKPEGTEKNEWEARLVAVRVAQLLHEGEKPGDIVILLRSLRSQAGYYLDALRRLGIPAVSDQTDNLLETDEIRLLLSYLAIIDNPHQDIPLSAVLMSPAEGFQPEALAQARIDQREADLYCAIQHQPQFAEFTEKLTRFRKMARQLHVGRLVRCVLEETHGLADSAQGLENLQSMYLLAAGFDPEGPGRLHDFLDYIEKQENISAPGEAMPDGVRLMSIHKSKGLEFPIVFVAGLATTFNQEDDRQMVQIHPRLGVGCDVVDLERRLKYPSLVKQAIKLQMRRERRSEELRVLYVALTRAKERLILTYASAHLFSTLEHISAGLAQPKFLAQSADSLGYFVLMAAMHQPEAGALLAGAPEIRNELWNIHVWTPQTIPEVTPCLYPAAQTRGRREVIPFSDAAMGAPAKLTATGLKGRFLDEESARDAGNPPGEYRLRQPVFLQGRKPLTPQERGTAVHLAMQYLQYERCDSLEGIQKELDRLVAEDFLLPEQVQCVSPKKLHALFTSPLGQRILSAPKVVREFKFSLFADGSLLAPALEGEKLLLQGVTDCCLVEPQGLCVIDFKTDFLLPGQEAQRAQTYSPQLSAYAMALGQIFACPVAEKIVYFFATDRAVSLE